MTKIFLKLIKIVVLLLVLLFSSSVCTYFIYDYYVVYPCIEGGGEYISDLTACIYQTDQESKMTIHAYTFIYLFFGNLASFSALYLALKLTLRKRYNKSLQQSANAPVE